MTYAATIRVAPVPRGTVSRLSAHNARDEAYAQKTTHIDPELVKDNVILIGTADPSHDLAKAIENIPMARKGAKTTEENIGAEIILTASAEYFASLSSQEEFRKWTQKNLEWLKEEFDQAGRGRVVNVILHMDEKAPHLHAVIAPIVTKSRIHPVTKQPMTPKPQINYNDLFGDSRVTLSKARKEGRSHLDTKLGRLQTSYAEAMQPCGLVRGRESARTKQPDLKHVAPHIYRKIKSQIATLEDSKKLTEAEQKRIADNTLEIEKERQKIIKNAKEWQEYRQNIIEECESINADIKMKKIELEKVRIEKEETKNELNKILDNSETLLHIYEEIQSSYENNDYVNESSESKKYNIEITHNKPMPQRN